MSPSSKFASPPASAWLDAASCGASGSEYQCRSTARKGSNFFEVDNPGDFQIGQEVEVSGCNIHHYGTVYNEKEPYYGRNIRPIEDEIELRGLEKGRAWQTFIVHFTSSSPVKFNWMAVSPEYQKRTTTHPVLKRHWAWNEENLKLPEGWMRLTDGVEILFKKKDWLPGQCISFHARNRLIANIVDIQGKKLVLDKPAGCDSRDALLRHHDQRALQSAVDRAIAEKKSLFLPAGRYRLDSGLWIKNVSLRMEGAHMDNTILDVSEAHTAVFWIAGGREVAIRNLGMTGHTGFLEMPANVEFFTATGHPFYPMANQQMEVKGCAAANIVGTEHLLFEDLKVSRMASEAYYLHGSDRYGTKPYVQFQHDKMPELQKQYTKSCVFHRCHAYDCGFNIFNNNDHAENTEILHCHVERAANFCENPSRFTRIIGNYVKDGCSTSVHLGARPKQDGKFRKIAGAHAIITDNVFEGGTYSGGIAIGKTASNVTVANNIFVGFSKETAICIWGGDRVIVTGNHIDLTRVEDNPDNQRCGVSIETSNVIVSNNQIYADGEIAEKATGINIADHVVNISVHDNMIENCNDGLVSGARIYVPKGGKGSFEFMHTESEILEIEDSVSFRCKPLPPLCKLGESGNRWKLKWISGRNKGKETIARKVSPDGQDIIITYSAAPDGQQIVLEKKLSMKKGDRFIIYPARYNWRIHGNTIVSCRNPFSFSPPGADNDVFVKENTCRQISCREPRSLI